MEDIILFFDLAFRGEREPQAEMDGKAPPAL
jgi:hypothetical protein